MFATRRRVARVMASALRRPQRPRLPVVAAARCVVVGLSTHAAKPKATAAAASGTTTTDYSQFTNKPRKDGSSSGSGGSGGGSGRNNDGWRAHMQDSYAANPWLHRALGGGACLMVCWGVYDLWTLPTSSTLLPPKTGDASTRPPPPTYRLGLKDQAAEHQLYETSCKVFEFVPLASALAKLKSHLDAASHARLSRFVEAHPHVLDASDLNRLCGYFELLRAHNIPVIEAPLHIRAELSADGSTGRLYVTTGVDRSLIQRLPNPPGMPVTGGGGGDADNRNAVLFWTHDHAWASDRFLNKPKGPSYLCGQALGRSKFAAVGVVDPNWTKRQLVDALGLDGYAYTAGAAAAVPGTSDAQLKQQGEPLHVVAVTPYPALLNAMAPAVPLIYKIGGKPDAADATIATTTTAAASAGASDVSLDALTWRNAANFLAKSIPGYTSGGLAEVLVNTVEVTASGLDDLARKGVRILTFK